jgi:hypothetical protein
LIETAHEPAHCASLYWSAIERFAFRARSRPERLATHIRSTHGALLSDSDRRLLAERIDWNAAGLNMDGRILICVPSSVCNGGHQERHHRRLTNVLKHLVTSKSAPRIEPIYWSNDVGAFRFARRLMLELLGQPVDMLDDDLVDFRIGEILVDLVGTSRPATQVEGLSQVRRRVTLSYHQISSSSSAEAMAPSSKIQDIAAALEEAGWHSG